MKVGCSVSAVLLLAVYKILEALPVSIYPTMPPANTAPLLFASSVCADTERGTEPVPVKFTREMEIVLSPSVYIPPTSPPATAPAEPSSSLLGVLFPIKSSALMEFSLSLLLMTAESTKLD